MALTTAGRLGLSDGVAAAIEVPADDGYGCQGKFRVGRVESFFVLIPSLSGFLIYENF